METLTLKGLPSFCEKLIKSFSDRQILLLKGDLGAGKTALVRELLIKMGSDEVASPTYSLIHNYKTSKNFEIYHLDLYRIEGEEDLESIGFWDLFEEKQALIIIEWPERMNIQDLPLSWSKTMIEILKADHDLSRHYQSSNL